MAMKISTFMGGTISLHHPKLPVNVTSVIRHQEPKCIIPEANNVATCGYGTVVKFNKCYLTLLRNNVNNNFNVITLAHMLLARVCRANAWLKANR